jgi:hypothetical protein
MPVREGWVGRFYEDFEVGDIYERPLGGTVTTVDNIWFTLLTQNTALCSSNLVGMQPRLRHVPPRCSLSRFSISTTFIPSWLVRIPGI